MIENLHAGQHLGDTSRETDNHHTPKTHEVCENLGKMGHEPCVDDDGFSTAEVQRVHQRWTAELGVQERRHCAERAQRQPRDREVGPVRHQHGHQLAALNTKVGQAMGKTHRPASSFAEGQVARREA